MEKLKAITRLSKCGFRFVGWKSDGCTSLNKFNFTIKAETDSAAIDDLDLLFGGGRMKSESKIMFDYLDWCKKRGIKRIEDTENRHLIKQYAEETGTDINGLTYGLMLRKLL